MTTPTPSRNPGEASSVVCEIRFIADRHNDCRRRTFTPRQIVVKSNKALVESPNCETDGHTFKDPTAAAALELSGNLSAIIILFFTFVRH